MIKKVILMVGLTVYMGACAAADVFGLSDQDTKQFMEKYGKEIAKFDKILQKEIAKTPYIEANNEANNKPNTKDPGDLKNKKRALLNKFIKENGYLFVDMQTIFYPEQNRPYTTIEIIDKKHSERLRFVNNAPSGALISTKRTHKPDIIETMITHDKVGIDLLLKHQISSNSSSTCPVYHCTVGFDHPKLKPYLAKFNNGVIKEKAFIIETLNNDPDPERRAAAAFLVGHFQDPHEIISILSLHLADKDEGVRNNVMRVIGATMYKAKINEIDVTPFVDVLDSPYITDRNKALYVLFSAAESKKSKNDILQKGGDKLVALVRLKQPNNHDWAYLILKKISGKDFGPTNVAAWTAWVSSAKSKPV